ncbi:MAG: MBL fold metallo-hydrolase [Burkholderiaceae bacterium]|nr:MBL fold metallo-hydrolase [Burkholderiaceae bacterium]
MDAVLRFGPVAVHLGEKSGKYPDGNQVLVQGADTRVAFDTPLVANRIGPAFDDVDLVVLGHVHEDHLAGLHRVPRARVMVHEADLAAARSWDGLARHYGYPDAVLGPMKTKVEAEFHYRPRPDATGYADGACWELGGGVRVRAHHLPGHTAGHCVLMVENEGLAFIGDIDLSGFGPYYGDATSSLADFRRTLVAVAALDARVWVTSHHRAVITDRADFLAQLAAFAGKIDEREARLLAMLAEGAQRLDDLARRRLLYPAEHDAPWVDDVERRCIAMHLDELLAAGRVEALDDGRFALR